MVIETSSGMRSNVRKASFATTRLFNCRTKKVSVGLRMLYTGGTDRSSSALY